MKPILVAVLSAILSISASASDTSARTAIIQLARECLPTNGTPRAEVDAIWDIPIEHNASMDDDIRAIAVSIQPHPGIKDRIRITYKSRSGKIVEAGLIFEKVRPCDLSVTTNAISFPSDMSEIEMLNIVHARLVALQKIIAARRDMYRASTQQAVGGER